MSFPCRKYKFCYNKEKTITENVGDYPMPLKQRNIQKVTNGRLL